MLRTNLLRTGTIFLLMAVILVAVLVVPSALTQGSNPKIKGIDESGTPFEQVIVFDRG
jgi:hypothetical protein